MSSLGIRIADGNWVIVKGEVTIANYLLAKIRMQLKVILNSWLYDTSIGSQVPQLNDNRQNFTVKELRNIFTDAVQPLEVSGEIREINIILKQSGISYYTVDINGIDSTGAEIKFSYNTKE